MSCRTFRSAVFFWILGALLVGPLAAFQSRAEDASMVIRAVLVWGTNDDSEKHAKYKEVDPRLKKKLQRVFKWKTYLTINQKKIGAPKDKAVQTKMSGECTINIQNLDGTHVRVKLYGKGKLVMDRKQPLDIGESMTVAGDDKNDTAWFVVLTRMKP